MPQRSKSSHAPARSRERDLHDQVTALVHGDHGDPFSLLGIHADKADQFVGRCYHPAASQAWVLDRAGTVVAELEQQYEPGFFAGAVPGRIDYRLRFQLPAKTIELEDPYRFPPVLGDVDMHLLAEGTHLKIYERLGAQLIEMDGVKGVSFVVWAPNARRVSVVGDFNDWDGRRHPMRKRVEAGVWELFLPGLQGGELYKFEIKGADGRLLVHPIVFAFEPTIEPANGDAVNAHHHFRSEVELGDPLAGKPGVLPPGPGPGVRLPGHLGERHLPRLLAQPRPHLDRR